MPSPRTPRSQRKRSRAEANGSSSPALPSSSPSRATARTPPTRRRKTTASSNPASSPSALGPSSPLAAAAPASPSSSHADRDDVLFTSPNPLRVAGPGTSEIDLSSPLNYGTPSSRAARTPAESPHGTPIRLRSDIRSERHMRQVNMTDPVATEATDAGITSEAEPRLVIWGTDVVVNETKERFRNFLTEFLLLDVDDGMLEEYELDRPLYLQKLEEISLTEKPFLTVNCQHLRSFNEELYRQLVCYPQEVIPTFDMAANELYFENFPNSSLEHQIQVRACSAERTRNMRALNPEDIDQLITISGMVIRTSSIIPEMREAFFRCHVCHATVRVEIDRGKITEPSLCKQCSTNQSMALVHNRSQFSDKQMVKLQESPDDMPAGQTPHTVILYAHNDLVDTVQPGDRVTVTGIYRAVPLRVNPRQRNVKAVYKTHIDVIHFQKTDKQKLHTKDSDSQVTLTEERIKKLKELSGMSDIYERLSRALAPSIYENDDIKKGILLQLFGGTSKDFTPAGRGRFRSDINILLCGDPGTSKSQLLQYVHNLVPRGQYTSGKGSSAVGLTAYITKDPETRQLVLQTGALVLSDNGICCIDEFDKMADGTRSVLHEVMEQQTLSIAKAGIICQLNARTAVLAAANPVKSQWDPTLTTVENIQLPHTLMSRFDLIFLMLDPQDELFDRRLATHLVSLYHITQEEAEEEVMDLTLLKDYIAYARNNISPALSEEAGQSLIHAYVDMRKAGSSRGAVTAYPRQLESLIRLAEAHAKMRFSDNVETVDVEEAKRLHREALKQSAMDPKTGMIDVSIITTGMSVSDRRRRQELSESLKKLIKEKGKVPVIGYQRTFEELRERSDKPISKDQFDGALRILSDDDFLIVTEKNIRLL